MVKRLGPHALAKICVAWLALGLALVGGLAALDAPAWSVPLLAGSLGLALPFVLVLAWALEGRQFSGRRIRD